MGLCRFLSCYELTIIVLDAKQFISAMQQIAEEKGIPQDKVVETIESAIAAAYKKEYGEKGQIVRAKMNPDTLDFSMTQAKIVVEGVDENECVIGEILPSIEVASRDDVPSGRRFDDRNDRRNRDEAQSTQNNDSGEGEEEKCLKFNPEKHITLEEAKKIRADAEVGEEIIFSLESKMEFGRIAAMTAKQVILQRIREVERDAIVSEFKSKEGQVVSGAVQRVEGRMIYVDLGRTTGILLPIEQIPGEHYRIGQRYRFYLVRVDDNGRGAMVILSRSHPRFVIRLFEFEVPEIDLGSVQIKGIAREPGSRSKIAVHSDEAGVDPIGSLVGQKGIRVQTVINELGGEKIDIIEWSEDSEKFIANALSPAKILLVKILNERGRHAVAEVADDQFSLAIGKNGQNVRLAAKLTGWKIDVRAPQAVMTTDQAEQAGDARPTLSADLDSDDVLASSEEPSEATILPKNNE